MPFPKSANLELTRLRASGGLLVWRWVWGVLAFWMLLPISGVAQVWISEILFNPPGSPDSPNEYIELRAAPNTVLGPETYFVVLEGDGSGNPGTVEHIFDLSQRSFGPNGFLLLLQKTNGYQAWEGSQVLEQEGSGPGWGHAGSSSIRHRGRSGSTEMENSSETFLLILAPGSPVLGGDVDQDDDGELDGEGESWVVLDSVGVLDESGGGDIAYGRTNFKRASGDGASSLASGNVIGVGFTPVYVARRGNSVGHTPAEWVAGDNLLGKAPNWALSTPSHTWPSTLSQTPLNHPGGPNFGASIPAGVNLSTAGSIPLVIAEGGNAGLCRVRLNTPPSVPVTLLIGAEQGLLVAADASGPFGPTLELRLSNTSSVPIHVLAPQNLVIESSPRTRLLTLSWLSVEDSEYARSVLPSLPVQIVDDDAMILSEVVANPVGEDSTREYVELRGPAGAFLTNVFLVILEVEAEQNPGKVYEVWNLSGERLGENGLLWMVSPGHPYSTPEGTREVSWVWEEGETEHLPNRALSVLLLTTEGRIRPGEDLDNGDNGVLEGLPKNTRLLDSVGWRSEDSEAEAEGEDVSYGTVLDLGQEGVPDAVVRFPWDQRPGTAEAWFAGDLKEEAGQWRFLRSGGSTNLPSGAVLTPGFVNNTAPTFAGVMAWCGALGDPTNPSLAFSVADAETPTGSLQVRVSSGAPEVIPKEGLRLNRLVDGNWLLFFEPQGVGYADVTLEVTDGVLWTRETFRYAVSSGGTERTRYHVGAGDGSAVVPLPGARMLVGDDENQVIRLYDRSTSGLPLARYNMTPFLGLTDIEAGLPREVDIEGVTQVGSRLFWIGAHSHANIAEPRTNRSRIFATDLTLSNDVVSLTFAGRYDFLKLDLVAWDSLNGHGKGARYLGLERSIEEGVDPKAPDGSGFNIEGLSMAPFSTNTAYVAFRAPLIPAETRYYAMIVPVSNYTALSVSGAPPGSARFGAPIELDLFGRGIRSIEGHGTNYLIVAGPPGPVATSYPNDFRLFTWTGNPADAPRMRSGSLAGLNPEAIVELPPPPWDEETEVQLVSDSGVTIWYGDGLITKALPEANFKKSRSDWVRLGKEVDPEPYLFSVEPGSPSTRVRWRGVRGHRYRVEWTDALGEEWLEVPGSVRLLSQPVTETVHETPLGMRRFYRVVDLGR